MALRDQFRAARRLAKLSQPQLSRATSWDAGHISKFERGERGASIEKLEEWVEACQVDLRPYPRQTTGDVTELEGLPEDHRKLLIRLGRLLGHLEKQTIDLTIVALIERWERDHPASDPSSSGADSDASLADNNESTGQESAANSA